jgi:hypothetical protein
MEKPSMHSGDVTPFQFRLAQNYPNPFNDTTSIKYCVPYATRVRLTVFNAEGSEVQILVEQTQGPGTYEVRFLPPDGDRRSTGRIYFYRLEVAAATDAIPDRQHSGWRCVGTRTMHLHG